MAGTYKNRSVLITGGTSGIGLALATVLHSQGARVAVCGRDAGRLDNVRVALPGVLAIACDVADPDQVERMIADVIARFGTLEIFVSNAGRLVERHFLDAVTDVADLREELTLNFVAPILMAARIAPRLGGASPALVMITSGYALVTPTRSPTYGAAKAGLRAFLAGLRRQAGSRLHVMEVLPPTVDTPATAHKIGRKLSPEAVAKAVLDGLDSRRDEVRLGQVRVLPMLMRLAPKLADRIVGRS